MPKRWRMVVELTFDIDPQDIQDWPGNKSDNKCSAPFENAMNALQRIRPSLNKITESNDFAHYHIKEVPKICYD